MQWIFVFGLWTGLALIGSANSYAWRSYRGEPLDFIHPFIFHMIVYSVWAALTLPIVGFARKFPLKNGTWLRNGALHVGVFLALQTGITYWRATLQPVLLPPNPRYPTDFRGQFIVNFYDSFWMYCTIVLAAYLLSYYQEARQREIRAVQLERMASDAQLQVLRIQLQPHFLFNTLHAISSLMHEDVRKAEQMLVRVGDLLRLTLDNPDQEVPLAEELDLLRQYLGIQQTRFGDRLRVEQDIDPDLLDAAVPSMMLQPLVENAVRFAVESRAQGGRIRIHAERDGEWLRITVKDDGPGLPAEHGNGNGSGSKREGGIGIRNTRERLEHLYGERQQLVLRNAPEGGAEVLVRVPYRAVEQTASLEVLA